MIDHLTNEELIRTVLWGEKTTPLELRLAHLLDAAMERIRELERDL